MGAGAARRKGRGVAQKGGKVYAPEGWPLVGGGRFGGTFRRRRGAAARRVR